MARWQDVNIEVKPRMKPDLSLWEDLEAELGPCVARVQSSEKAEPFLSFHLHKIHSIQHQLGQLFPR